MEPGTAQRTRVTPSTPQNKLGLQPWAHPSPLPRSPGYSPHLSGNVIGSLGRCVGYLRGYHHHLGSSWIHMGRRARPGRCVALHAGCTGGRLGPVLVEMLWERQGYSEARAPVPPCQSAKATKPGPLPTPSRRSTAPITPILILDTERTPGRRFKEGSPPHQAAVPPHPPPSRHPTLPHAPAGGPPGSIRPSSCPAQPTPSPTGPAAPAPGAGHGCTQLSGRSRRALQWGPALALNAGTCSPTVPCSTVPDSRDTEPAAPSSPCLPACCFAGWQHPRAGEQRQQARRCLHTRCAGQGWSKEKALPGET